MTPKQRGANYKTVEQALRDRLPFEHSTMSGEWFEGVFTVKSYSTVVARIDDVGERWINSLRYSQTTSRHLGIIRRAWATVDSAPRIVEKPATKGMIGTQAEAEVVAGLSYDSETPSGWEFAGSGCSRRAYLSPSGVIYKVQTGYDDANDNEYVTACALIASGAIPEGWDVPRIGRYRVEKNGKTEVILAMENLGPNEVSVWTVEVPVPKGYVSHNDVVNKVFGVFDSHGGNIRQRADGTLVCIDMGFSGLLPGSAYADC